MKIRDLQTFPVALALRRPFRIASASFTHLYYVIVRIETDDGAFGYGESIPAWEVTGETQFGVIDCLHHLTEGEKLGFSLIGQELSSLRDVERIMAALCPIDRVDLVRGAPAAKAGLEEAMLDLVARGHDQPIYELFGGSPRPVPFAPVLGIGPLDTTVERARRLLSEGIPKIKLKIGVDGVDGLPGHGRDVRVVRAIRELIAARFPGASLVADANQGFVTAERTLEFLRQVPDCLDYLEQPVLADDFLGMKKVKEHGGVRLMADESLCSYHDAKLLLALDAVDVFNVKLMKCGGMFQALRLAALAKEHGKRVILGSMLESQLGAIPSLHAFFADRTFESTESGFFDELAEQIGSGLSLDGTMIRVPKGPGTGIRVDEGDLRRHLVTRQRSRALDRVLDLYQ